MAQGQFGRYAVAAAVAQSGAQLCLTHNPLIGINYFADAGTSNAVWCQHTDAGEEVFHDRWRLRHNAGCAVRRKERPQSAQLKTADAAAPGGRTQNSGGGRDGYG